VALLGEQGDLVEQFAMTPREHTRYLPIMMDSVLEQAGIEKSALTHIAFANGPGAFTGVRIAAATAQGLSIGLGCPLVAVSTLAVLAQVAADNQPLDDILAALDARMGEAYVGHYLRRGDNALVKLCGREQLLKLAQLSTPQNHFLAGSGFAARRAAGLAVTTANVDETLTPRASALARLAAQLIEAGKVDPVGKASINYLRNQVAVKSSKKTL